MEQSTKEMKKRFKGLLTLVLIFLMMFGNSLTVLAQNYAVKYDKGEFPRTLTVQAGDTLELYSEYLAGYSLTVDGKSIENIDGNDIGTSYTRYSYPVSGNYNVTVSKEQNVYGQWELSASLISFSPANPNPQSGTGQGNAKEKTPHSHDFKWQTVIEPTIDSDGLSQLRCPCGAIEATQPISGAIAYVSTVRDDIENAPQSGLVEIKTEQYRCYTAKIMKTLRERPDVSLKTTFLDEDGTWKSFTIPAGQAPADEELFYGFTYLGNLYGWNEVPEE